MRYKFRAWVTLSNFYNDSSVIPSHISVEDKMRQILPGNFKIIKLSTPLRMSGTIAEAIKKQYEERQKVTNLNFNERLMAECNLPPLMVKGQHLVEIGLQKMESLCQNLHDAFNQIPKDTPILITINDRKDTNITLNKQIKSLINCQCFENYQILAVILCLRLLGRPLPLIHTISYQSPEKEVKNWMSSLVMKDLIGSLELVRGFESDVIIDLSGVLEVRSRASVQFIQVFQNWFLTAYFMKQTYFGDGHDCTEVMEKIMNQTLVDFDKKYFSISTLIGKQNHETSRFLLSFVICMKHFFSFFQISDLKN